MGFFITQLPDYEEDIEIINGDLKLHFEEESVVWLWARPEILSWPNPIFWILSPVNQRTTWTGDLWGIDSEGELVIIEGKYKSPSNPFVDFVEMLKKDGTEPFFSATKIEERWRKLFRLEILGANGYAIRKVGKTQGILPRSSKRICPRFWKHLTIGIDHYIRSEDYANSVKSALKLRNSRGNPQPHFAGLLVVGKQKRLPRLSTKGEESKKELEKSVGKDHVHLYISKAKVNTPNQVEISVDIVK